MENSRRPFDRSRDPGPVKKQRLNDEPVRTLNPNGRPFPAQRPVSSVAAAPASRFRATVRETEDNNDPSREAYQPQPINPHHELVDQYKSALSELTFNSKPMITNLTIIAGESLQAAKAIAATICNNILEVPSEQKLPSLYLLDSIVKNIGRDYIKHFAPRLPEVFVKAFRQVDPSTRSSMRHLFGTWKGVFHPQTLQIIDKELEFTSKNDGSSSAVATSRNDSQPQQRQAHGIHVNPKYLERQRIQQSARAKGMVDDVPALIANSESDRLERTPGGPTRAAWIDPSVKLNRIRGSQRDGTSEPFYEKDIGAALGEHEYGSGASLGIKKTSGRIAEEGHEEPWFGTRSSAPEMSSGQRDGLNAKNRVSRSAVGISNSWKNSEEEEFMWDMHSRVNVVDVANNTLNPKSDIWAPDDLEKLDSDDLLLRQPRVQDAGLIFDSETSTDTYTSEPKNQTVYGRWTSSSRPLQDDSVRPGFSTRKEEKHPSTVGGLPSIKAGSTISRKGNQPQVASSRVGPLGSRTLPNSASGSVRQTPISHSVSLQNSAKQDVRRSNSLPHRDPRAAQFSGKPPGLSTTSESPSRTVNGSGLLNPLASEVTGQSDMSSLLAAVVKSGIISNNLATAGAKDENVEDEEKPFPQSHARHFLPSSGPRGSITPSPSHGSKPAPVKAEQKLPPVCPQASISATTSSKASDAKNKALDPISNLLNSLVSKGLISASKPEAPSLLQPQMPSEVPSQSPDNSSNSSSSDSAVPSNVQPTLHVDKVPAEAAKTKELSVPSEPTKTEVENLIGCQFKPNIIREFHPSVISSLFDGLPHQCNTCGIHFKHKEQLDRHLELHSKDKLDSTNPDKPSWGWYAKADDWVAGDTGFFEPEPAFFYEPESGTEDGPMVSADESQYACILCGELFEDYFCQEKDQWMFKGAVYMTIPPANTEAEEGPIVHAACLTETLMHELGFGSIVKQEKED